MRITPAGHIEKMSGAHSRMIYFTKKTGETFSINRNTSPRKKSSEQRIVLNFLSSAARNWELVSDLERSRWIDYGKQHFSKDSKGRSVTVSGVATYARANFNRLLLGLPLVNTAPVQAPPPSILSIEQLGAQNPNSLGLTVMHAIANTANLSLLVRMTPAGTSPADDPADNSYYYVKGVSPASAVPLPLNAGDVTFSPTKFVVEDGERYGVEVRVVRTTDGLVSEPVYGDFRKLV